MSRKRKLKDKSDEEISSDEEIASVFNDNDSMDEDENAALESYLNFCNISEDETDFKGTEDGIGYISNNSDDEEPEEESDAFVENVLLQTDNINVINDMAEEAYNVISSLDTLALIGEKSAVTMAKEWVDKVKAAVHEQLEYCNDVNKSFMKNIYATAYEERMKNVAIEQQDDSESTMKKIWEDIKKFYLKRSKESLEDAKYSHVGLYIKSQTLESITGAITSLYEYAAFMLKNPAVIELEDILGESKLTKNLRYYKNYLLTGRERLYNRYTFVNNDYYVDNQYSAGALRRNLISLQFSFATVRITNAELCKQKIEVAQRYKQKDEEFWENSAAMTYRDLQEFIHLNGITTYPVLKNVCLIGMMIVLGLRPSSIGKTVKSFDGMLLSDVKIRYEHEKGKYSIQFRIRHEKVLPGNKNRRFATLMTLNEKYDLTRLFLIYLDARNAFKDGLAHRILNNLPLIIDEAVMNEPLFVDEFFKGTILKAIARRHINTIIKDVAEGIGVPRRMVSAKSARRGHATDKLLICLKRNPLMDLDEISKQLQVNEAWHSDVGLRYAFAENGFVKECHQRVRLLAEEGINVIPENEFMHLYKIGQLGVERPERDDPTVKSLIKCLKTIFEKQGKSQGSLNKVAMELVHENRTKLAIQNNTKPIPKESVSRDPSTLSLVESGILKNPYGNTEIQLKYDKKCCFLDNSILNYLKADAEHIWIIGSYLSDSPNDMKRKSLLEMDFMQLADFIGVDPGLLESVSNSVFNEINNVQPQTLAIEEKERNLHAQIIQYLRESVLRRKSNFFLNAAVHSATETYEDRLEKDKIIQKLVDKIIDYVSQIFEGEGSKVCPKSIEIPLFLPDFVILFYF